MKMRFFLHASYSIGPAPVVSRVGTAELVLYLPYKSIYEASVASATSSSLNKSSDDPSSMNF